MDSLLKFCICNAGNGGKENRMVFVSNSKKFKNYNPKWKILKFSNS